MVTLSRSDLFLVVFAAIVLGGMVATIFKATVLHWLTDRSIQRRARAARAALGPSGHTRPDALQDFRSALADIKGIQEGAFLAGWRECEHCHGTTRPEQEDHVLHHFTWRDATKVTETCARRTRDASAISALDNLPSIAPWHGPAIAQYPGAHCGAQHTSGLACGLPTGHAGKHRTPTATAAFHPVSMHGGDGPCASCAQEWSPDESAIRDVETAK